MIRTLALALLVAGALPAAAVASSASVEAGGAVRVTDAAGQTNALTAVLAGGGVALSDSAGITIGSGCARVDATHATCTGQRLVAALGDGDDTAIVSGNLPAMIDGGAGNDTLTGGEAPDVLEGGAGADVLAGGAGDDVLYGDGIALAGQGADDRLDGGPGADVLVGDGGRDLADYSSRTAPVSVTLDGLADDGAAAEGDAVSVEDVRGGSANDVLVGDDGANDLEGGPGADTLRGAGGDDRLQSRDATADVAVDCGDGAADTADADAADVPTGCEQIAPAAASAPAVTGEARVGSTLTATAGDWRGLPAPAVALQWLRCAAACTAIPGADAAGYSPVEADLGLALSVRATAVNDVGTATADTARTAAVVAADAPAPPQPPPPPPPEPPPPSVPATPIAAAPIVALVAAQPVAVLVPAQPAPVTTSPAPAAPTRQGARLSAPRSLRAATLRGRGLPVTVRCTTRCRARVSARPLVARTVTAGPAGVLVHLRAPRTAALPATLTLRVAVAGAPTATRRVAVLGGRATS